MRGVRLRLALGKIILFQPPVKGVRFVGQPPRRSFFRGRMTLGCADHVKRASVAIDHDDVS